MERPLSYGREHIQTFVSPAETAFASVERTANQLRRDIHRTLRTQGLTWAQYNVLRALGKEASGGLTCSELGNPAGGGGSRHHAASGSAGETAAGAAARRTRPARSRNRAYRAGPAFVGIHRPFTRCPDWGAV
jgi:hypothetical protein